MTYINFSNNTHITFKKDASILLHMDPHTDLK